MVYKNIHAKRKCDIQKIEARAKILTLILQGIAKDNLTFRSKKKLLLYVARKIEDAERLALERNVPVASLGLANKAVNVGVSGLYKSEVYSAVVDGWISENPKCVINKSRKSVSIDPKLRLDCAILSNECVRLNAELKELNSRLIEAGSSSAHLASNSTKEEINNAYFAIDALLEEFGSFLKLDEGGVFLDNVLQRRIIPMDVIKGYFDWKRQELDVYALRRK